MHIFHTWGKWRLKYPGINSIYQVRECLVCGKQKTRANA